MKKVLVIGDLNEKLNGVLNRAKNDGVISDFINYEIYNNTQNKTLSLSEFVDEFRNLSDASDLIKNWIILKGNIHTKDFLKLIINFEKQKFSCSNNLFLSHLAYLSNPSNDIGFYMSDAALNVTQITDANTLKNIIKNSVDYISKIKGYSNPSMVKTAIVLAARNEKIPGYDVANNVINTNCLYDLSLLQFDECFSKDSFINKNKVPGSFEFKIPELLITPDITTGNCIWKSLTILNNWNSCGYLTGGQMNVVLLSRSDSAESYYKSIKSLSKI